MHRLDGSAGHIAMLIAAAAAVAVLSYVQRRARRTPPCEHVDLSLVAEEAAETLLPLAEQRRFTVEAAGDVAPTIGSHALLLQLSTNVLHNAIVHNLPEHGAVWVTTVARPAATVLIVENTGEKLAPHLVATLAEPFLRGTTRIRTDHAGVGLGLAIVKSITQAHDGALTLTPRAGGGLRVEVELPLAPTRTAASPTRGRLGANGHALLSGRRAPPDECEREHELREHRCHHDPEHVRQPTAPGAGGASPV